MIPEQSDAVLALISDFYRQLQAAMGRIAELEAQLGEVRQEGGYEPADD
jgi:hypothetical protein